MIDKRINCYKTAVYVNSGILLISHVFHIIMYKVVALFSTPVTITFLFIFHFDETWLQFFFTFLKFFINISPFFVTSICCVYSYGGCTVSHISKTFHKFLHFYLLQFAVFIHIVKCGFTVFHTLQIFLLQYFCVHSYLRMWFHCFSHFINFLYYFSRYYIH